MSDDDLIPVHLAIRDTDGTVSVRMLLETPIGNALVDGEGYERIGQIKQDTWREENRLGATRKVRGWAWYYDDPRYGEATGRETTKAAAIKALLEEGGYIEAPPNAATQPLF